MSEQTGHAAFHLKHVAHGVSGNRADRRAILHESMRHLDTKDASGTPRRIHRLCRPTLI
jgi:hypothetical protein